MRTSTSGLLLVLIGVTLLSGFLTGNLDRWLSYLFDPTRPALSSLSSPTSAIGIPLAAGERRTPGAWA
jgi:hypothetical protein